MTAGGLVVMQIKEAVLECGTDTADRLTDEELAGILQCLPTAEDRQRLRMAPANHAEVGTAEQFMLAMMAIPHVRPRVTPISVHVAFQSMSQSSVWPLPVSSSQDLLW
jgi:hypothetical protein